MSKRVEYHGRKITVEREQELKGLSDNALRRRIRIAEQMCDALDAVEKEYGSMWRAHERSHWPLRLIDYLAEWDSRYEQLVLPF